MKISLTPVAGLVILIILGAMYWQKQQIVGQVEHTLAASEASQSAIRERMLRRNSEPAGKAAPSGKTRRSGQSLASGGKTDSDLLKAVRAGDLGQVTSLLAETVDGASLDAALIAALRAPVGVDVSGILGALLKAGANPDARYASQIPALHLATRHNRSPEAVRLLVAAGADVAAVDSDGATVVFRAVQRRRPVSLIAFLVQRGADVNHPNKHGETPLLKAAAMGEYELASALLRMGANADAKGKDGLRAIDLAKKNDRVDLYSLLTQYTTPGNGDNFDPKSLEMTLSLAQIRKSGYLQTELVRYIKRDDIKGVKRVLKEGADYRGAPLVAAAEYGRVRVARWFLDGGANPDAPDHQGLRPLFTAVPHNRLKSHDNAAAMVRLLLSYGADATWRMPGGDNILLWLRPPVQTPDLPGTAAKGALRNVANNDHKLDIADVVKQLVKHGAPVNVADDEGRTPLSRAVWAGAVGTAEVYLAHGASADAWAPQHKYLLDIAAKNGYGRMARLLIEHGAKISESTLKDIRERLLMSAVAAGDSASVRALLKAGAMPDRRVYFEDAGDETSMTMALKRKEWNAAIAMAESGVNAPGVLHQLSSKNGDTHSESTAVFLMENADAAAMDKLLPRIRPADGDMTGNRNPLIYAIKHGFPGRVGRLLAAGANPKVRDDEGRSALELSIAPGREDAAIELLRHGAAPDDVDKLRALWQQAHEGKLDELARRLAANMKKSANKPLTPKTQQGERNEPEISLWAQDCDANPGQTGFAMVQKGALDQFVVGNGVTAIPMPGFRRSVDVYDDPRIQWTGPFEMRLTRFGKNAINQQPVTYHMCGGEHTAPNMVGVWSDGKDGFAAKTLSITADGGGFLIPGMSQAAAEVHTEPAYRGLRLRLTFCGSRKSLSAVLAAGEKPGRATLYLDGGKKIQLKRVSARGKQGRCPTVDQ